MARIVHLSTVHQTRDNRVYNKECKALLAAGHDLTLVIRADADEARPVPIASLPTPTGRLTRVFRTQLAAWRSVRKLSPELLHVHDPELIPFAWAYRLRHGSKIVYDAHEDLVGQVATKPYLKGWQRPIMRRLAAALVGFADRRFDAVVAATERIAADFTHAPTAVVRNYPWRSDYDADPHPEPGRVVYVGDLTEQRKLSFMIDVVRRARTQVPEAHLVLAGRPARECQPVLDREVDDDAVHYLGLLPPEQVPSVLASAQVGLVFLEPLPNYLQSLPTKLFEYMASGVPYLASDFPFWVESFAHHSAGRFVDSSDSAASADALVALLRDPDACTLMGGRGRDLICSELNFEHEADKLRTTVASLVD